MSRGSNAVMSFRTLTDEQMSAILREAAKYGRTQPRSRHATVKPWWVPLLMLLCNYGPRVSEALTLRREQVDFGHMEITFPTLKRRRPTTRTLPLFPEVATALQEYLATRTDDNPLVFPHRSRPAARSLVWVVFQKLLDRAGVPRTKVHALRHSVATKLALMDLATARDVLGHASLMTTDRYIHATRLHDVFERLIPIALGNGPASQAPGHPVEPPPPKIRSTPDDALEARVNRIEGAVAFLAQTLGGGNGAFPPRPAMGIPIAASLPAPSVMVDPRRRSLREAERDLILTTLQSVQGNQTRAAELLGISRRGLHYKLKRLREQGIQVVPLNKENAPLRPILAEAVSRLETMVLTEEQPPEVEPEARGGERLEAPRAVEPVAPPRAHPGHWRSPWGQRELQRQIEALAKAGFTSREIAGQLGVTRSTVTQRLRGIPRPARGRFNKGGAKLTEADVITIREERRRGVTIPALARRYGIEESTMQKVVGGQTWRHVPGAVPAGAVPRHKGRAKAEPQKEG